MEWYLAGLKKYAVFSGRARRKEYWMFLLCNIVISFAIGIIGGLFNVGFIGAIYALATFIPGIAVTVRRLHDIGRSGWWIFVVLIPLIGIIAMFIFMVLDGDNSSNKYGKNPKEQREALA